MLVPAVVYGFACYSFLLLVGSTFMSTMFVVQVTFRMRNAEVLVEFTSVNRCQHCRFKVTYWASVASRSLVATTFAEEPAAR